MAFLAAVRSVLSEAGSGLVGGALLIAVLGFTPSGDASAQGDTHDPPDDDVPLPAAPAVLTFRGGAAAFNGTHWGGAPPDGNDGCEGTIRQALGLLDAKGSPISPVPGGQRISLCAAGSGANVGGVCANDAACDDDPPCNGGEADCQNKCVVSGLSGNNYRAFNIDVATFRAAFGQLAANENLYMCGHGPVPPNGGRIQLEGGVNFDGFVAPGFAMGTNASPDAPYPGLAAPPGAVTAHIHHCYSGRDPGGAAVHAVSATLDAIAGVTVAISHMKPAQVGAHATFDELCDAGSGANEGGVCANDAACDDDPPCMGGEADCEDKCKATVAQANAAIAAINGSRWQQTRFPMKYSKAQGVVPVVGGVPVIQFHLTYGDEGPAEAAEDGLDDMLKFLCFADTPSLDWPGLLAVPLLLALTGAACLVALRRRPGV